MLKIDELIKESMKNHKFVDLKVYRNLKSMISNFKTQKNAPEYDEAAEISVIKRYITNNEEALKQYSEAGRTALVSECSEELEVLKKLLPEPVTAPQIYNYLLELGKSQDLLESGNLQIPKRFMGVIIKSIKNKFPAADGKMISEIVKDFVV